jgi:hypothetical protein
MEIANKLRHLRGAFIQHPVARKLPLEFSEDRLGAALSNIPENWWEPHLGPYHNGLWELVALWAPRGDRREQRSVGGPFGATEALAKAPGLLEVLDAIPGERNRVRLMRLKPGGHIREHSDPTHQISHDLIRLHLPIISEEGVKFLVNRRPVVMKPGEVWDVNVRFPHEVINESPADRVHLVVDMVRNQELDELLTSSRSVGQGFLTRYHLAHALPAGARRILGVGN